MSSGQPEVVLATEGLSVAFKSRTGTLRPVLQDVNLSLRAGQLIGLAGESGCGKSTFALTALGYRLPGAVSAGRALLGGVDLLTADASTLRSVWGSKIAYLPQDASSALNPAIQVGRQIAEPMMIHLGWSRSRANERALELLGHVDLPSSDELLRRYPHQFSGGQQQRLALAIAISCGPSVLILDEPTTGLDVTTQATINKLIKRLAEETGVAMLYVSHNLSLLATLCDELAVMYAGRIVELGPALAVYRDGRHPYTVALLNAIPRVSDSERPRGIRGSPPPSVVADRCGFFDRCDWRKDGCLTDIPILAVTDRRFARCVRHAEIARARRPSARSAPPVTVPSMAQAPLLVVDELTCSYRYRDHMTTALDTLSLRIAPGGKLGIAGESGSGKSTLLKALSGLVSPTSGRISLDGQPLAAKVRDRTPSQRADIQIVFQNPDGTLNPRQSVAEILDRPLKLFRPDITKDQRIGYCEALLEEVGLDPRLLRRYPQQLSGGQRQRIALARAVAARPRLILCDEVTSALDVSVQASVIDVLHELTLKEGMAMIFVTHDLGVLRSIADEIVVLRHGMIRESGATTQVFEDPRDSYTRALLAAVPDPDDRAPTGLPAEASDQGR